MTLNEGIARTVDESTRRNWNHHVGLATSDYSRWKLSVIDQARKALGLTSLVEECGEEPRKVEADPEKVPVRSIEDAKGSQE